MTGASVHLAAAALLAHLLIAAHTVSHVSQGLADVSTQHCVFCTIGDHSAGIPAAVVTGCHYTATWIAECVGERAAPPTDVEESTLARAPPTSPPAIG